MAVADAVLQRNAPLPPGLARRRPRIGVQLVSRAARHRDRPITGQPVRPVLESGVQGPLDQQSAESGAVDEQLALDGGAGIEPDGADVALTLTQLDVDDAALDPLHAPRLAVAAQVAGVERGIEMEGIGDLRQRRLRHVGARAHELVVQAGHRVDRVVLQLLGRAGQVLLEPVLMEVDRPRVLAHHPETMDVAIAEARPVDELDAELEGGLGLPHELVLVELEHGIEHDDGRDGRLADAHRADFLRLDQRDRVAPLEHLGERRGRHPAG